MADLDWYETPAGYESRDYRILRIPEGRPGARWQLENSEPLAQRRGSRRLRPSFHATLTQAMDFADRLDRRRRRWVRFVGHSLIAIAAGAGFAAMVPIMTSPLRFTLGALLFFVALRSFTHAMSTLAGDAWGWPREKGIGERITTTDRLILGVAERIRQRNSAAMDFDPDHSVTELPPEEPDNR